ncbi:unnamed protein product, partial [Discosporangium mesarthrocarpum]
MKIAIYSHSIPPAVDGVSRRMTSVLDELHKAGHEVVLFTLESDPQIEKPGTGGEKFRHVTLDSTFPPLYPTKRCGEPTLANQRLILRELAREKPDVLHCTIDGVSGMLVLAARTLGIPVAGSVHTDIISLIRQCRMVFLVGWGSRVKEMLESLVLDSCATTSLSFKELLRKRLVPTQHIIKTGVQVKKFCPEARSQEVREKMTFGNPDGLLVVYVGRLAPEK